MGRSLSEPTSIFTSIYIAQLRKKIENDPSFPAFILTESGIGYRFSEQTEK